MRSVREVDRQVGADCIVSTASNAFVDNVIDIVDIVGVVAGSPIHRVGASPAIKAIIACVAVNYIVSCISVEQVVARPIGIDIVIALNVIVAVAPVDRVVPDRSPKQNIVAIGPVYLIGIERSANAVSAGKCVIANEVVGGISIGRHPRLKIEQDGAVSMDVADYCPIYSIKLHGIVACSQPNLKMVSELHRVGGINPEVIVEISIFDRSNSRETVSATLAIENQKAAARISTREPHKCACGEISDYAGDSGVVVNVTQLSLLSTTMTRSLPLPPKT